MNADAGEKEDIEYTVGLAGGVPVIFISVGISTDDLSGFIDVVNSILRAPVETRPTVVATVLTLVRSLGGLLGLALSLDNSANSLA
ncbi:hypothetical protein GGX14DRAFT_570158 [Mycena pura]|uniref:Uncharacterized protein n=1 Tax=Mycena pura TaxID=153505 RepID=A0AAD6V5P9_9AGAR|nr:hypothetical protein GGX14DRAFT_570158 [Mycena pura]